MITCFIDNGTTGSMGFYGYEGAIAFFLTPVKKEQDYTKKKQEVARLDASEFARLLIEVKGKENMEVVIERPLVNPTLFKATVHAVRCYEATITALELLGIGYRVVDSKDWQRGLLPSSGKKGTDSKTLKKESMDIGIRMFPQFEELIRKHKDADGILGAYAMHRR